MQLKNTQTRYGAVTKAIHWLTALIVIGLLCLGFVMDDVGDLAAKLRLYGLHKSFGATVLFLTLCRVAWHLCTKRPPLLPSLKNWEKAAAHAVHILIYAAIIAMPLSGWLMSSAAGRPVAVFGLFTLPDLVAPDQALREAFGTIHYYLAFTIIALVTAHAGAALKHHFIAKDATLRRMLPFARVDAVLLAVLLLAAPAAKAEALKWRLVPGMSDLSFQQQGGASAPLASYNTLVAFDPAELAASRISFSANLTAALAAPSFLADPKTQDALRGAANAAALAEDAPNLFVFDSGTITRQGANAFTMTGTAAMNGQVREISIPFVVAIKKDGDTPNLVLSGDFAIDFADFPPPALGAAESRPVAIRFTFFEEPVI